MAGAPGFEPGITGPKPAALPLGYAPPASLIRKSATRHFHSLANGPRAEPAGLQIGIASDASALGYAATSERCPTTEILPAVAEEHDQRDDSQDAYGDQRNRAHHDQEDRD
jgi:hypothetical protein